MNDIGTLRRDGAPGDGEPLLRVDDLSVTFRMYADGFEQRDLTVISNLSLDVRAGEIVAVAGSSGSGKSLLAHAVMGLLPENARVEGAMRYKGAPLTPEAQARLRGSELALVPQSVAYLDPTMRVGEQAAGARSGEGKRARQRAAFARFGLDERVERMYPFELSGGMARRVLVSTAVIGEASLIIADEPTPGLDLAMATEALACFRELADEGRGVVLITHDIDLAVAVADRVAVFYAGTTVEIAAAADFTAGPDTLRHPYAKALWRALPQNGFEPIPGFQPYAGNLPHGCLFAPRCPFRTEACEREAAPMREVRDGMVRCIHAS